MKKNFIVVLIFIVVFISFFSFKKEFLNKSKSHPFSLLDEINKALEEEEEICYKTHFYTITDLTFNIKKETNTLKLSTQIENLIKILHQSSEHSKKYAELMTKLKENLTKKFTLDFYKLYNTLLNTSFCRTKNFKNAYLFIKEKVKLLPAIEQKKILNLYFTHLRLRLKNSFLEFEDIYIEFKILDEFANLYLSDNHSIEQKLELTELDFEHWLHELEQTNDPEEKFNLLLLKKNEALKSIQDILFLIEKSIEEKIR